MQGGGGNFCIRRQEGQHGRHIWRDHAAALGDAGDGDLSIPDARLADGAFREGIRGHDGLGSTLPITLGGRIENARQGSDQLFGRQFFANHAGGSQEDFLGLAAQDRGSGLGGFLTGLAPGSAGKDIGIAGCHHQATRLATRQGAAAPIHRRARAAIAGEDARHSGAGREGHYGHIIAILVANRGAARGNAHPRHRRHFRQWQGEWGGGDIMSGHRASPVSEHFQAKWNHLAARKMRSNNCLVRVR